MKLTGGADSIINAIEKSTAIISEETRNGLQYLGEECVKGVREKTLDQGTWHDRTGNLRSSIGYAVVDHGKNVSTSAFPSVNGASGTGATGSMIGQSYVEELAAKYSNVEALVVVAGMNYAACVEARGFDVLAGAKISAEHRLNPVMKVFMDRAERRITAMLKKK